MQFVDPAVSRRKFDREVSAYRANERLHVVRGWWLMYADFPKLLMAFVTPKVKPATITFGALLDFTNFDVWAPSVRIVDPFTEQPYPADQLPVKFLRRPPGGDEASPPGSILQYHAPALPFVCLAGVREYHEHPSHSGDHWLLLRGSPRARPFTLLEQLYTYGCEPIDVLQIQVRVALAQQRVPS